MGIKDPIRRAYVEDGDGNLLWQVASLDAHLIAVMRGQEFFYDEIWSDVGSGSSVRVHILTPADKNIRLNSLISSSDEIEFAFYEGSVVSGGTQGYAYNRNRNHAETQQSVIYKDPIVTDVGLELLKSYVGGSSSKHVDAGGSFGGWLMLKKNEHYLLEATSLAVGNRIGISFDLLELSSKSAFM